jgi:hypothetical protein
MRSCLQRAGSNKKRSRDETNMTVGNESLDPRAIATAPIAGLNATKMFLEYQASMLRMWANNCELAAHNFERGLDTFKPAREQRREAA